MLHTSRLYRFGVYAHNPVLTNPVLIKLIHNRRGGTDSSGEVGSGSINLEFSVNSVFVKPPFVEYPSGYVLSYSSNREKLPPSGQF